MYIIGYINIEQKIIPKDSLLVKNQKKLHPMIIFYYCMH